MFCRRLVRPGLVMKRKRGFEYTPRARSSFSMASEAQNPTIELTPREQQLRQLLLDVAKSIDEGGHCSEPIVLRWAGGWVRDRLLKIESHDIDVAINAMTGVPFARHMCDFCERPEIIEKHGIGPDDIGNLHNVARNPEKSKHLETAMVRMFGLDLDFVNLRKETYTEDSRNPQMEFGTAEEDALRRDATVNALFYNLHTDRVEDFTGGLRDMKQKTIRTPMEPLKTFMDDPLRVLRLIRFAGRLQFRIDPTTCQYMGDSRVLDALRVKISRERVGVELEKMLKGAHPVQALKLIDNLGLYSAIFTDPNQDRPPIPDASRWSNAYLCLFHLLSYKNEPGSIANRLVQTDDDEYIAWNLAAVCPWMPVEGTFDKKVKPNSSPMVAGMAREGFKAPNRLSDVIAASHRHRREILKLKTAVCSKEPLEDQRVVFGTAIRRWDAHGGSWRLQVLNALLVDCMESVDNWTDGLAPDPQAFLSGWSTFLDHLAKLDVYEAPSLKRLLDGRRLAKALGVKPGKWTGKALEVCVEWQLRNPEATDPEGAIEELRQRREELAIPAST